MKVENSGARSGVAIIARTKGSPPVERCLASASAKPTARQVARPMVTGSIARHVCAFVSALSRATWFLGEGIFAESKAARMRRRPRYAFSTAPSRNAKNAFQYSALPGVFAQRHRAPYAPSWRGEWNVTRPRCARFTNSRVSDTSFCAAVTNVETERPATASATTMPLRYSPGLNAATALSWVSSDAMTSESDAEYELPTRTTGCLRHRSRVYWTAASMSGRAAT